MCIKSEEKIATTDLITPYKFNVWRFAVPMSLIATGFVMTENSDCYNFNQKIRNELQEKNYNKLTIDNYTQYAPIVAMYVLDVCKVRGRHDYVDQTILLGTASLLTFTATHSTKALMGKMRPDGSTYNSFPSGHTSTAFMGAHLLAREYWHVSPWIGVGAYTMALGTGFLRMYNDRHWLTDVVGGAGVGILCAEAAYWLYPAIAKLIFPKRAKNNIYLAPYYSNEYQAYGLRMDVSL